MCAVRSETCSSSILSHNTGQMSERKTRVQMTSLTSPRSPTSECIAECVRQTGNERRIGKKKGGQRVTAIRLDGKGVLFPTNRDLSQCQSGLREQAVSV